MVREKPFFSQLAAIPEPMAPSPRSATRCMCRLHSPYKKIGRGICYVRAFEASAEALGRMSMKDLNVRAWLGLVVVGALMALLLFLAAGTLRYWQAWVFLLVFLGASAAITLYLAKSDPALLQRRVTGGPRAEDQTSQKIIMTFAAI